MELTYFPESLTQSEVFSEGVAEVCITSGSTSAVYNRTGSEASEDTNHDVLPQRSTSLPTPLTYTETENSVVMVQSKIKKFRRRFKLLTVSTVKKCLEKVKITVALVVFTLISINAVGEHKVILRKRQRSLFKCGNHWELFARLNPYWNYLAYDLFYQLIEALIVESDSFKTIKKDMEVYKQDMLQFMDQTPLNTFCKAESSQDKDPPPGFSILVTKFNWPHSIMLGHVEQFRRKYAHNYNLNKCAMMLNSIETGSCITWFVPTAVVDVLQMNINLDVFREFDVIKLEIHAPSVIVVYPPLPQKSVMTLPDTSSAAAHPTVQIAESESVLNNKLDELRVPTGGYVLANLPSEIFCPVTKGLMFQPHLTSCCGNHISEEIATRIQGEGGACPVCNKANWTTFLNKGLRRQIFSQNVYCHRGDQGCGWQGKLADFSNHVDSCPINSNEKDVQQLSQVPLKTIQMEKIAFEVCMEGNLETLKKLSNQVDFKNVKHDTWPHEGPLHVAAGKGNVDVVKYLITEAGCDINVRDCFGKTPLHWACSNGHLAVVYLLTEAHCDAHVWRQYEDTPLHLSCENGHLTVVKYLVIEAHSNPNAKNKYGQTPLIQACRFGHLEVAKCLVTEGQSKTDVTDNNGVTPLNWASRNGHLDVVRYLVSEAHCNSNVRDHDGESPLHKACINGHLKLVRYLVTEAHCDPHVINNAGESPLRLACRNNHVDVVQYLVTKANCDPNEKNCDGWTPLHWACKYGKVDMVKVLLLKGHSNPNILTKDGSSPLLLADNTHIIKLLLQHCAVPEDVNQYLSILPDVSSSEAAQPTISLVTLGDKKAGKSTLVKALTTERASIYRWTGSILNKVSGVKEKTSGIQSQTIHSDRIGHLAIYDMACDKFFHVSHGTIISSCMSRRPILLFVIDLESSEDDLRATILYWLSFIQVRSESSVSVAKPYLIAVGSHADLAKSKQKIKEKEVIVQSTCENEENIDFVGYVKVDCRYSESAPLTKLRSYILATHNKLQEGMPNVSPLAHSLYIYLVSECSSKPGIQLGNLISIIQADPLSIEQFLPLTIEALHEACCNLDRRGVMLYIQAPSIESSWIIIHKDILMQKVNGSVFSASDPKSLTGTGVVPFSMIKSSFPQFEPRLVADFLVYMEFCREMTDKDGINSKEPIFLFPGLVPLDPPPGLCLPNLPIDDSHYSSCWILQCQECEQHFSSHMQEILLLHLAFIHTNQMVDTTSPAIQHECVFWRRGIKWTTRSSIDTLVKVSDRAIIVLQQCGQGREMQLVQLRSRVVAQVQNIKTELCNDIVTVEELVPCPQYPVDTQSSVSLYQLMSDALSCWNSHSNTPLFLTQTLFFEPYTFCSQQCLVDLNSKNLESCKVTSNFIESVTSNITKHLDSSPQETAHLIDDFCTILNVPFQNLEVETSTTNYEKTVTMFREWQTGDEGTYQCLRQQMDKYSIFSGRNIMEIVNVSPDSLPLPSSPPCTDNSSETLSSAGGFLSTFESSDSLSTPAGIPPTVEPLTTPDYTVKSSESSVAKKRTPPKSDRVNMITLACFPTSSGTINILQRVGPDYKPLLGNILLKSDDGQRIRALEMTHSNDVDQIVYAMFQKWCTKDEDCTWRALVLHLKQANLTSLASEIESSISNSSQSEDMHQQMTVYTTSHQPMINQHQQQPNHSEEATKLDDEISREVLADIARDHLKNWRHLSPYLGLSHQKEIEISQNYQGDYATQKRECLEAWREAMGSSATYQALISASEKAKDKEMADSIRVYWSKFKQH